MRRALEPEKVWEVIGDAQAKLLDAREVLFMIALTVEGGADYANVAGAARTAARVMETVANDLEPIALPSQTAGAA